MPAASNIASDIMDNGYLQDANLQLSTADLCLVKQRLGPDPGAPTGSFPNSTRQQKAQPASHAPLTEGGCAPPSRAVWFG